MKITYSSGGGDLRHYMKAATKMPCTRKVDGKWVNVDFRGQYDILEILIRLCPEKARESRLSSWGGSNSRPLIKAALVCAGMDDDYRWCEGCSVCKASIRG